MAIARALAQEPDILLADEPVAALDPKSAIQVMDVLRKVNQNYNVTVITNLHHLDYARTYCERILGVSSGIISFDGRPDELFSHNLDAIYENKDPERSNEELTDIIDQLHEVAGFSTKTKTNNKIKIAA